MAQSFLLLVSLPLRLAYGAATIPGPATQAAIVEKHNEFRCTMCDTPKMQWDDEIAQNAKDYMDTGASQGHCPSRDGSISGCVGNGENMFSDTAGDDAFKWQMAIDM